MFTSPDGQEDASKSALLTPPTSPKRKHLFEKADRSNVMTETRTFLYENSTLSVTTMTAPPAKPKRQISPHKAGQSVELLREARGDTVALLLSPKNKIRAATPPSVTRVQSGRLVKTHIHQPTVPQDFTYMRAWALDQKPLHIYQGSEISSVEVEMAVATTTTLSAVPHPTDHVRSDTAVRSHVHRPEGRHDSNQPNPAMLHQEEVNQNLLYQTYLGEPADVPMVRPNPSKRTQDLMSSDVSDVRKQIEEGPRKRPRLRFAGMNQVCEFIETEAPMLSLGDKRMESDVETGREGKPTPQRRSRPHRLQFSPLPCIALDDYVSDFEPYRATNNGHDEPAED